MLAFLLFACDPKPIHQETGDPGPAGETAQDTGTPPRESGDSGRGRDTDSGPPPGDTAPPPTPPTLSLSAPPAWDPLLSGPLAFPVSADADGQLTVSLQDAKGASLYEAELSLVAGVAAELSWDGAGLTGTGALTLLARFVDGETALEVSEDRTLQVVRCGFTAVTTSGDLGVTAQQIPLYWHLSRTLQDPLLPLAQLESLEDEKGLPRDFPAVSSSLDYHLGAVMVEPSAWTWDSRPMLKLTVASESRLGALNTEAAGVTLQVEGWTVLTPGPIVPGGEVLIQKDEALSDSLGVVEQELTLTFTAADPEGGEPYLLGSQALPTRMYSLYDEPSFGMSSEIYNPWVAAIDPALRGIEGTTPDPAAVLDALVEWIFYDLGLTYDTVSGASVYASYRGDWSDGHFNMTDFLTLRFGDVVNCSDCAGILTTYANMLGSHLSYLIILSNFELNEILAIGQKDFTSCPFGRFGCGFSYHAVTTNDGAATIWDATLALDGDKDPGWSPHTTLMVEGVTGEEYLYRLVRSGNASYNYETVGTIQ